MHIPEYLFTIFKCILPIMSIIDDILVYFSITTYHINMIVVDQC